MHVLRRGRDGDALSYADLFAEAGRVAAGLLSRGVRPGERVALVLPTSVDFARAFFGVLAAGAVAVPLPGPAPFGSSDAYLRRTAAALRRSRVRTVLTAPATLPLLGPGLVHTDADAVDVLLVAEVAEPGAAHVARTASDPAVVQYTSGTSSEPRGVVLSHGNVAAGVEAIAHGTRLTTADVGCAWLPLFHDMGLVGSFLTPLLHDVDIHLLTPEDYLRDPRQWIQAMGRLGATFTMAPDSGYRYVLRRDTAPQDGLDLSRWRIAVNGAEPVDRRLQDAFVERYAPAGLPADVFLPAYGLAEATLAVAFPPVGRPTKVLRADRDALGRGRYVPASTGPCRELVSVGTPVRRTEVRLTTAGGAPAAPGTVGAVEVRGASVTSSGYDRRPEESRRVLLPGGWVATGDLGLWHDGELYVVGRTKEVIIVFGANHWASDIEAVVRDTPGLPVHGVLAEQIWSDEGGRLGLVVETARQDEAGRQASTARIRARVVAELGITPDRIEFVRRGRIARTSSGKAVRHTPRSGRRPELETP
ncbi:AMP-binding protein [Streptomyces roseirectus]|uniref:AMP-binding protein n=1 Tax=Streptomyces roseirectus TaxID=2768066 RepID=A0A7H0ITK6_9ACTN|nr:AMP-binding protein [Streptomyces roseirectus]